MKAPIAKKVPHLMNNHNHQRIDDYYWLRDDKRQDPEIIAHLEAENSYCKQQLLHTEPLQKQLFNEFKNRIEKDDNSVPVKDGQYFYSTQMQGDNEYPIFVRSKTFADTSLETLLDVNALAQGADYFDISGMSPSPSADLIAYSEDTVGRRVYTIKIKVLSSGNYLSDEIEQTEGYVIWANDDQSFYYIKKDPETLLGYQVYRHILGTKQAEDILVYQELDNSYYLGLYKSKDNSTVFIIQHSTESSGISLIHLKGDQNKAESFIPREPKLEYQIAKLGDWFYIYTNYQAKNFCLMKVNFVDRADKTKWQVVIPHRRDVLLEDYQFFDNHLVYSEKEQGINRIFIRCLATGKEQQLQFNDLAFTAHLYGNNELGNSAVRLSYTSLTTPTTHYDFDLNTAQATQLKQQRVLGDFSPEDYQSERFFVAASDGKKIPVSLVYRKDLFNKDGTNPLVQYGYGSYGLIIEPSFSSARLSLLDRGFVYAIAHVRGSEMLGREWYEQGKKLNKINTFNDFIKVTQSLTKQGYANHKKVYAAGGSAGGLLMGAVINKAPELYHGVAAHVPFVDVLTTMLDESIPLTTNEYDEWGNPNEKTYYDYILSYSPYDQIKQQAYPHMLVTTGLHDSQVQYFEPAKWVAKLREFKTDDNTLVFKVDMSAGHGGMSGRFEHLKEEALEYAFFIDLADCLATPDQQIDK